MTERDLIITPLLLVFVFFIAYLIRPFLTTSKTRRYFIPALTFKIIGALAVGIIYQFYYQGGDTFTYFTLGSSHIWEAFLDSPWKAISLIIGPDEYSATTYEYASRIYTFGDKHSYFVVRLAGFLGIITLNTYSAIAVLFAVLSFTGVWSMYVSLLKLYPRINFWLAVSILFVPSVVFWGSGLLKDTLTIGALGWLTWGIIHLVVLRTKYFKSVIAILIASYVIYIIKIYILLCLLPALLFWVMLFYLRKVRSVAYRLMTFPIAIAIVIVSGYFLVLNIGETSHRYSIDKLNYTAEATAKWNYYVSQQEGGSGYTLGSSNDFTTFGMIQRSPEAVWVALFRPYIWEADNLMMFLSGFENFLLLLLTLYVFVRVKPGKVISRVVDDPYVFFSLLFVITFAFAIGISTYNFGALVRYKIPIFPFLLSSLFILMSRRKTGFDHVKK